MRGRKSGVPRTVPLLHVRDGERVVLIASNWGRGRDPNWALNLAAADEATVALPRGEARLMRSRPATPDERVRYWSEALRFWPGYETYRSRADREIPMFTLDPADVPDAES